MQVKSIIIYAVTKRKSMKVAIGDIFFKDGSNQIFEYSFGNKEQENKIKIEQDVYNYPAFYMHYLNNKRFVWLEEITFMKFVKKCKQLKGYISITKKSR